MKLRELDLLAQAASFGYVSIDDLAPPARTAATISPTYRKLARRAFVRLRELEQRGLLTATNLTETRFEITLAGRDALQAAGFAPDRSGSWVREGARRPGWAS